MGVGHVSIYMDLGVHMPVCTPGCVCMLVNVCISGHLGCSSRTGYTHVLSYIALQPWAHVTKNHFTETSLAIQSLVLHAANTGGKLTILCNNYISIFLKTGLLQQTLLTYLLWFSSSAGQEASVGIVSGMNWKQSPLEKEMATHSSILAWEIPWTQEPGGL